MNLPWYGVLTRQTNEKGYGERERERENEGERTVSLRLDYDKCL